MSTPASPRMADWQGAPRVPKLGFRKALSPEEAETLNLKMRENAERTTDHNRGNSITANTRSATPTTIASVSNKKKGSFLSGLFVKEPTMTALASFEADVKAKYGATTPQAVPHVSSQKMPEHVPKVNTRWDGVPEVVKLREKEEKQRRRISQQTAHSGAPTTQISYSTSRSTVRSHDQKEGGSMDMHSDTGSHLGSWYAGDGKDAKYSRRGSFQSSNSTGSQRSKKMPASSLRSQSFRSPSGTSLPEITYFFPDSKDVPASPSIPEKWKNNNGSQNLSVQPSKPTSMNNDHHDRYVSSIDVMPDHSISPINTPGEMSPITPGYLLEGAPAVLDRPSESESSPNFSNRKMSRVMPSGIDAFLAGEAKPLSLDDTTDEGRCSDLPLRRYQHKHIDRVKPDIAERPDTSRGRLGLRASMLITNDVAPWDMQTSPLPVPPTSRTTNKNRLPKALAMFR